MRRLRERGRDERGTTLVELVVGMAAGLVVMAALITLIMVTLNTTSRVSARVHATQEARIALTRIIEQLHSACIAPKVAPIRAGSSDNELRFVHATGSAVSPTPTLTKITYSGGALTQRDYAWKSGTAPFWVFEESAPIRTVLLNDRIAPITGKPIFAYYGHTSGAVSTTAFSAAPPGGLSEIDASRTIQVSAAFKAVPRDDNGENATPTRIQGSASLQLTASSYNAAAQSTPCQ